MFQKADGSRTLRGLSGVLFPRMIGFGVPPRPRRKAVVVAMPDSHIAETFKHRSNAGKVSVVALLLLPLIGLGCVLLPSDIVLTLPYLLGGVMAVSGIASVVAGVRARKLEAGKHSIGTGLVMGVVGVVAVLQGSASIIYIGVIWGVLGLLKAAHGFDDTLRHIAAHERFILILAFAVFNLVVSILLVSNPFGSIDHHIIVLGVELLAYPFRVVLTKRGMRVEAEPDEG